MADDFVRRSDVHKVFQPKYAPAINRTFAAMIDSVPAADVAEVVRCCECIHHDGESQYHYCHKWRRNCPNDSDFFCKWGERKDGGQEND